MADHVDVPRGWRIAYPEYENKKERQREVRSGHVFGVLVYTDEGEAEALIAPWFMNSNWLTRADGLLDSISVLQVEYERLFDPKDEAKHLKRMAKGHD